VYSTAIAIQPSLFAVGDIRMPEPRQPWAGNPAKSKSYPPYSKVETEIEISERSKYTEYGFISVDLIQCPKIE
jgi:hypothetical protein